MEFSNSRNERSEENQGQNTWKDESLFIKALSKGDEEAYRYLYKTYAPRIGALVKSYLGTDDIDDVIQEVFLRIYKNIKKFRGESKLSTWIYRITVNVCNNVYKKLKSKGIIMDITESNESDEYTYQFPTEEDVKKNVADEILYEKLRKTLDTLNPEDRALLFMKEIDGLTYEEIGNILKKPEGTVKSRLHYIKEKIRKALEEVTRDE